MSLPAQPRWRRVVGLVLFAAGVVASVLLRSLGGPSGSGLLAAAVGGLLMGAGAVLVLGAPRTRR